MSFRIEPRPFTTPVTPSGDPDARAQATASSNTLNAFLALAVRTTGWPRAGLTRVKGTAERRVASIGFPHETVPEGDGLISRGAGDGEPRIIPDLAAADLAATSLWRGGDVAAVMAQPLRSPDGRLVGVLYLLDDAPHAAGDEVGRDLAMLAEVGADLLQIRKARCDSVQAAQMLLAEQSRRETLGRQIERLSHIGAWSYDIQTGRFEWSDRVYEIHGRSLDDPPTIEEAIASYTEEDRPVVEQAVQRAMETGQPYAFEADIVRPDGTTRRVSAAGDAEMENGRARRITGIIQDLTLQRDREAALEWVLDIISHARDAFVVYDADERVVFWNQQAERTFGWTREEALGQDIVELLQIDPEAHALRHERMLRNGSWSGRAVYKSRAGLNLTLLAHKSLIVGKGHMKDGVIVVYQDVSEKMVLSEKMQTATRLDAIGQLTGGIAHDFNNLLTVIMGSADLLKVRLKGQDAALKLVDMNRGAAERGRDLVAQLLAFARRQMLDPTPIDVAGLIEDARPLVERAIGEQYHLTIDIEPDLWLAEVDPAKLDSALMNLCINARDACQPGIGRIHVDVRNVTLEDPFVVRQADGLEGDFVVLSVSDNGCGMSPEVMRRAIEPFFSTKKSEEKAGTGLGLSMTYGFVKQSGGNLQIYSEEGRGTTMRLYLPRSLERAEESESPRDEVSEIHPLDILVVEDDPRVRDNTVAMLTALGHRPVTVGTAADALRFLETGREGVELLFTDVVLPGSMSGFDLGAQVSRRWPDLPVLFCSGYTHGIVDQRETPMPKGRMLSKPYSLAELSRCLAASVGPDKGPTDPAAPAAD